MYPGSLHSIAKQKLPEGRRAPQAPHAANMPTQVLQAPAGVTPCIMHDRQIRASLAPVGQLRAKANVGVFAIHEVAFIESTNLLKSRYTPDHASTIHPVCCIDRNGDSGRRQAQCTSHNTPSQTPGGHQMACKVLCLGLVVDLPWANQSHILRPSIIRQVGPKRFSMRGPENVRIHDHKPQRTPRCTCASEGLIVILAKAKCLIVQDHGHFKGPSPQ